MITRYDHWPARSASVALQPLHFRRSEVSLCVRCLVPDALLQPPTRITTAAFFARPSTAPSTGPSDHCAPTLPARSCLADVPRASPGLCPGRRARRHLQRQEGRLRKLGPRWRVQRRELGAPAPFVAEHPLCRETLECACLSPHTQPRPRARPPSPDAPSRAASLPTPRPRPAVAAAAAPPPPRGPNLPGGRRVLCARLSRRSPNSPSPSSLALTLCRSTWPRSARSRAARARTSAPTRMPRAAAGPSRASARPTPRPCSGASPPPPPPLPPRTPPPRRSMCPTSCVTTSVTTAVTTPVTHL